jgi:hypothetical protein
MKPIKCSSAGPCPDQLEFYIKNDTYSIAEDALCCSYCGINLDSICEELYSDEDHKEDQKTDCMLN